MTDEPSMWNLPMIMDDAHRLEVGTKASMYFIE